MAQNNKAQVQSWFALVDADTTVKTTIRHKFIDDLGHERTETLVVNGAGSLSFDSLVIDAILSADRKLAGKTKAEDGGATQQATLSWVESVRVMYASHGKGAPTDDDLIAWRKKADMALGERNERRAAARTKREALLARMGTAAPDEVRPAEPTEPTEPTAPARAGRGRGAPVGNGAA